MAFEQVWMLDSFVEVVIVNKREAEEGAKQIFLSVYQLQILQALRNTKVIDLFVSLLIRIYYATFTLFTKHLFLRDPILIQDLTESSLENFLVFVE